MFKRIAPALVAAVALGLAACGTAKEDTPSVSPETAKTRIEQAAKVELAATPIRDQERDEGLKAAYSNAPTVAEDGQAIGLFVLESADVADEVRDAVASTAPESAKLIVNDEVIVVYAATGKDRGAAVEKAVNGL